VEGIMKYLLLFLSLNLFSAEHLVEMKGMKFIPENITIKKNDTVVFRNTTNTLHNVETKDKKIKSKMLKKGEEFKYKFDKVEKIDYYCKPHKNMGMVGTVKVEE
jgi:plastocyanin